jgi:methyl-accepting chemotaxis protein
VVGLDIGLANLQQLSLDGRRELFDGQGQVSIASAAGLLAGNSRDDSALGQPMDKAVADGLLRVAHPSPDPRSPWQVLLELPESVLQAPP